MCQLPPRPTTKMNRRKRDYNLVNNDKTSRRRFVGLVAAGVVGGFAGCINGDGDSPPEETDLLTQGAQDYLRDANLYDKVVDRREIDQVSVMVGAGDNGIAFEPAVIRVSLGAWVKWEWTGQGGQHNVVARDDTFYSGDAVRDESTTFYNRFKEEGEYVYLCEQHENLGMKGAVIVDGIGEN